MGNKRLVAVVSDAGPLIHLAQSGKVRLLSQFFGVVLVTEQVKIETFDEGIRLGYADAKAVGEALAAGWLRIEPVPEGLTEPALKLSEGENISRADATTLLFAVEKKRSCWLMINFFPILLKCIGLRSGALGHFYWKA